MLIIAAGTQYRHPMSIDNPKELHLKQVVRPHGSKTAMGQKGSNTT